MAGPFPKAVVSFRKHVPGFHAVLHRHAETRMPALQLAEREPVVGVQEVIYRMLLAPCPAVAGGLRPGAGPGAMTGRGLQPVGSLEQGLGECVHFAEFFSREITASPNFFPRSRYPAVS